MGRIATVVVYLLTIAAAYGGRVNPSLWGLPSILTLAFPYFAGATLLCILVWAVSRRIVITALGVLTVLACLGPLSNAFPIGSAKKAPEGSATFSLMTFNILHGCDVRYPDAPGNRSIEFLIHSGADIICLQEVEVFSDEDIPNLTPTLRDSLFKVYPYRAGNRYSDTKVLSKFPVRLIKTAIPFEDVHGRFTLYSLDVKGHTLHIINTHLDSYSLSDKERGVVTDIKSVGTARRSIGELRGPIRGKLTVSFKERAARAATLRAMIDTVPGALIVCGDFNDVPESWAYRKVRGSDLRDAYAETNIGPTYTYNEHLLLFHIDQILYKGPIEALSVRRDRFDGSDHFPLVANFAFTLNK